jgi:hypothetical protein
MMNEARQFSREFERIVQEVLYLLQHVPATLLDHPFPTSESYSLFVLATYLVEVGEFWIVGQVGRKLLPYRSLAEFCATGTLPALVARYQRWLREVHEILDELPDGDLDQMATFSFALAAPAARAPLTIRSCLQQAVHHTSLILEHMKILYRSLLTSGDAQLEEGAISSEEPDN